MSYRSDDPEARCDASVFRWSSVTNREGFWPEPVQRAWMLGPGHPQNSPEEKHAACGAGALGQPVSQRATRPATTDLQL